MNKTLKIDQPGIARRQLSFFISLQNPDGLNFVTIGQTEKFKVKLVNNGWDSFQTQRSDTETNRARIVIDFSKAGDITFTGVPARLPGFKPTVDETGKIFTFEQSSPYWNWFSNDSISIYFPAITANSLNGCGFVEATIENVEGTFNASSTSALFVLNPEGETSDISATWRYDNSLTVNGLLQDDGGGVMKLVITSDTGFIRTTAPDGKQASFYIQLSDGYAHGFNALMPPDMASRIVAETSDTNNWRADQFGNTDYPVWKISYDPSKGGSAAEVLVKLNNVQSLENSIKDAQCLLYYFDVPGMADSYQVLNITVKNVLSAASLGDDGGLTINSFTPSTTAISNINGPAQVLLSWSTSNAEYVTLSGTGLVDLSVTNKDVYIEQTTTFVLTAYSASLTKAVSQSVTVTVSPDLLSRVIPQGTILLWSGTADRIPANWSLCDGTKGTPDLRDKFVVGAGATYAPNSNGAANSHTHNINPPAATFTSSQDGQHSHALPHNWYARNLSCGRWAGLDTNGGFNADTTFTQDAGLHTHNVTVTIPGFVSENNNSTILPPWYALCYIMKQGV